MAYSRNWDESDPPGTTAASDIDREIREVKVDLRERLEQVINDWTDDGVDPKTLKFSALDATPQNLMAFVVPSIGSGSTVYVAGGVEDGTESNVSIAVATAITVTDLQTAITNPTVGETITATVRKNASSTGLSATDGGSASGSVDFGPADRLALEVSTTAGSNTTALKATIAYEFQ